MNENLAVILNGYIIRTNMNYERKEPLFYLVKRTKTPSLFIQEVKSISWLEEDIPDIKKMIINIKMHFKLK